MGGRRLAPPDTLASARKELSGTRMFKAMGGERLPFPAALAWLRSTHAVAWRVNRAASDAKRSELRALRDRLRSRVATLRVQLVAFDDCPPAPYPAHVIIGLLRGLEDASPGVIRAYGLAVELMSERPPALDGEMVGFGRRRRRRDLPEDLDEAGRAALERAVGELFVLARGLHPPPSTLTNASVLNRDAGRHYITQDPRELAAATYAGTRTWLAYPYYQARFGDRGRRFTRSDSAWLASLGDDPAPGQQVDWLAGVLAARGMPTLLLETHLKHLQEALIDILPHRDQRYAWLKRHAESLHERRHAALTPRSSQRLAAGFAPAEAPFENMGAVLVAAAADDETGYRRALESVLSWAIDADRFGPGWVAAVEHCIAITKRAIQRRRRSLRPRESARSEESGPRDAPRAGASSGRDG